MDDNFFSSFTTDLVTSLNLDDEGVAWDTFLALLMKGLSAVYGDIQIKTKLGNQIHFDYGNYSDGLFKLECYPADPNLNLILYFDSAEKYENAGAYWAILSGSIAKILQLSIIWQEKYETNILTTQLYSDMNIGLISMNEQLEAERNYGAIDTLYNSRILETVKGKVRIVSAPYWLTSMYNKMIAGEDPVQAAYKVINTASGSYRCFLIYQRNDEPSWNGKHQLSLMFYKPAESNSSDFLQRLFSISDSEAEIASCFSEGLTAEEVSLKTGYKVSTVYSYIKKLYGQLDINKQSQLTAEVWPELPI